MFKNNVVQVHLLWTTLRKINKIKTILKIVIQILTD